MGFLKNLFGGKDARINSYADFWAWFQTKEKDFHKVVKNGGDIEKDFFRLMAPKLDELRAGYFYVTGMLDDNTVELIITGDGAIRHLVFVEELVAAAPEIGGWKFTAHKPAIDLDNVNISMNDYQFGGDTLSFLPVENPAYPDEIEITVVHPDLRDDNREQINNGIYIFLDHYLGELNFATSIDLMNIESPKGKNDLVPVSKLKDYLIWREKEFIEKYEGVRHNTADDNYTGFEATLENGNPVVAVMNNDLLHWDRKASHPWILKIEIRYEAVNNGMPDQETYALMDDFENQLAEVLKDSDGYLSVGRQTADGLREVFFACKDFRKSSKVTSEVISSFADRLTISYDIYKDKYWRTFDRFINAEVMETGDDDEEEDE